MRSHPVSALSEAYDRTDDPIHAELARLRQLRSTLATRPRISGSDDPTTGTRRLRVGPQAIALREIDALAREAHDWFATYHDCLTALWEVAGREEARALSVSSTESAG